MARTKRLLPILELILGAGLIDAVVTLGITVNDYDMTAINARITALNKAMVDQYRSLGIVTKTLGASLKQTNNIMEYMGHSIEEIYELVEKLRCASAQEVSHLTMYTGFRLYKGHLSDQLEAIMSAATTGVVTASLIGSDQAKELLYLNPTTHCNLIHQELSLFYKYARAYTVIFDFKDVSFGYILRIPNPSTSDMMHLYKIYNT